MHYVKIWSSLYDGTMADPSHWESMAIWPHVLLLTDSNGVIEMTHGAISRRTGIPEEIVRAGIAYLESEDPNSRTPSEEGRRMIRLHEHRDWGWRLVNFDYYRGLQSEDRNRELAAERMRRKRAQDASVGPKTASVTVTDGYAPLRQVVGSRKKAEGKKKKELQDLPQSSSSCGDESTLRTRKDCADLAPLEPRPPDPGDGVVALIPVRLKAKAVEITEAPITERLVVALEREYPGTDVRSELVEIRRWGLQQAAKPRRGLLWVSAMAGIHGWLRRACRDARIRFPRGSPAVNPRAEVDRAYLAANGVGVGAARAGPTVAGEGEADAEDPITQHLARRER